MRFGFTPLLLGLFVLNCKPAGISDEIVDISGEFLSGGHCHARSPRAALAGGTDSGKTTYDFGGIINVGPDGFTVHVIRCEAPSVIDSIGLPQRRQVQITLSVPKSLNVPPGTYKVVDGGVSDQDYSTVGLAFWHPAYDLGAPGSGSARGAGVVYLAAISGELHLTRIDPPGVPERGYTQVESPVIEGRFVVKARRKWSMN